MKAFGLPIDSGLGGCQLAADAWRRKVNLGALLASECFLLAGGWQSWGLPS